MAKKQSIEAGAAPRTREEAEAVLSTIGRAQQSIAELEALMNQQLTAVREDYEGRISELTAAAKDLFTGLQQWAEANRGELLVGNSKTVKLASGELQWRTTPPKVSFAKGVTEEDVIDRLNELGVSAFTGYVRVKHELDKEALLKNQSFVDEHLDNEVRITQRELFVAKPTSEHFEHPELTATAKKPKAKGGAS